MGRYVRDRFAMYDTTRCGWVGGSTMPSMKPCSRVCSLGVQAKADVNAQNLRKNTALHFACVRIVVVLDSHVRLTDRPANAMDAAAMLCSPLVRRVVNHHSATDPCIGMFGWLVGWSAGCFAFHSRYEQGHEPLAKFLQIKGAKMFKNTMGKTPRMLNGKLYKKLKYVRL